MLQTEYQYIPYVEQRRGWAWRRLRHAGLIPRQVPSLIPLCLPKRAKVGKLLGKVR